MMDRGEIFYLKETNQGTVVKRLVIEGYQIPQLDRIEKKVDRILELLEDKETSTSIYTSDCEISTQKTKEYSQMRIEGLEDKILSLEGQFIYLQGEFIKSHQK